MIESQGRLVRLIPPTHTHILNLFNYRLASSPEAANVEFLQLLYGTSPLYADIPTAQTILIRSILSHFHTEVLKRTRPPSSTFNFQSASVGNLFLTGVRLFSGSFESAIYLLAIMGGVDESRTSVLPVILSNFTHHISAGLANGDVITGQNAISHPSVPTALNQAYDPIASSGGSSRVSSTPLPQKTVPSSSSSIITTTAPALDDPTIEDATLPGSLPTLRHPNITFSKQTSAEDDPLPAPIRRIWYINPYGQKMLPSPNPKALSALASADAVIYSIGSLYTSIVPSLIVPGIGAAISRGAGASAISEGPGRAGGAGGAGGGGPRFKILILNGCLDRETPGYQAGDFVEAIVRACMESEGRTDETKGEEEWTRYVTHVIHLEGEGTPKVDKAELAMRGVECIRVYGRKGITVSGSAAAGVAAGGRYDGKGLAQALDIILGRRERTERGQNA